MVRQVISCALAAMVVSAAPAVAGPPAFTFNEVGAARGLSGYTMSPGMGGGVAAADYDNDGDVDLFVPTKNGQPDQLYVNQGNGVFTEIAGDVGLASTDNSRAGLWFDGDGDGRLDLLVLRDVFYVTTYCGPITQLTQPLTSMLYYRQNADGTFTDVTVEAGLYGDIICCNTTHWGGLAAGDIDNDGFLDLCVAQWDGWVYLYHNQGDGTFADISISSNVGVTADDYWQPVFHDFNGDGWLDIFIAEDFESNKLWINLHNLTFADFAAGAGVDNAMNDMGVTLGDYDNDGDFDIYITNITDEPFEEDTEWNILYRNDSVGGALSFTDVAIASGVDDTAWGWGTTFLDADNDGWLDIAATNGFCFDGFQDDRSKFFLSSGSNPITFEDVSTAVGFDDDYWGSCIVAFDADRDGDLDLAQTCVLGGPLRLLDNQLVDDGARHWLLVQPRQSGPNTQAIGARVRAVAGSLSLTRLISAGTSLLGQEPAEAFFGLGSATTVALLQVTWPDGETTTLTNIAADQVIMVNRDGCEGDTDGSGVVDVDDLLNVILDWGTDGSVNGGDVDGSGLVDVDDLLTVLLAWGEC